MINAQSETAATKPAFRNAFKARRCLVVADGFYPIRTTPRLITLKNNEPFSFAGLWESWRLKDGKRFETFTILTCPPNEFMATIHNRMPVMLALDAWGTWLGETAATPDQLQSLCKPFPSERMTSWAVSPLVGNAKNKDAALVETLLVAADSAACSSKSTAIDARAGIVPTHLADGHTTKPTPRRGSDGQFHFLYVLYRQDTLEWYGGRHSTDNLSDGYKGSGNWARLQKQIAPHQLVMQPIEFFPDVASLKYAQATWITLDTIAADPLCRNEQEGGHGLTSASAKAMHARPGHSAVVGKTIRAALQDPEVNRRLRDGQKRGWKRDREKRVAAIHASITPELCALRSINSREVNARPEVKEKRSRS